jgi:hypothetical protein
MQHLEDSGTPVLYIGRTVLKGKHYDNKDKKYLINIKKYPIVHRNNMSSKDKSLEHT